MNKTIEERILELEKHVRKPVGTQLVRIQTENKKDGVYPVYGVAWCLCMGQMDMPKCFFNGNTIEEVISMAEEHLKKYKDFKPYTIEDALNSCSSVVEEG
jgi:predicted RNase H-like HicB family nuclease